MGDHFSSPRVFDDPAADIADVYVFPSPERPGHIVLVLTVFPSATVTSLFSDAITYRFRIRPVTVPGPGAGPALGNHEAAIGRLRPPGVFQRRPGARGQARLRPQRRGPAPGGRAVARYRGSALRRAGGAPSGGLRRPRGRLPPAGRPAPVGLKVADGPA
jgi:hypothetical protein